MNTRRFLSLMLLVASGPMLVARTSSSKTKDHFAETGTLTAMQDVPCGSLARGFTGIGGVLATAGVEHVTSKDKLCQEYVLRTSYLEYRIRPLNEKDAVLLPVGEKSQFRIVKDHVLLSVPEGDGKVREYKVVAMKPLDADAEDSRWSPAPAAPGPVQLHRRSATDDTNPSGTRDSGPPPASPVSSNQAVSAPVAVAVGANSMRIMPAVLPTGSSQAGSPQASPSGLPQAPEPDSFVTKPLTRAQVMGLVAGGVASGRVAVLVKERGISFQATPEFLEDLKSVGATGELLNALSAAKGEVPADAAQGTTPHVPARPIDPAQMQGLEQIEQQDRAAELSRPGDPSAHFALADALGREGKWSEAAAQYTAVISSEPNDAAAHNNLALALRRSGDIDGAIREYHRALAIDPSRAAVHDNLGVALCQKGDVDGALAEFREAVRQDPTSAQAHSNLGSALQQRKDMDGAIREYQQALSLGGGAGAQYNLATALELKGDLNGAVAAFRQALTTNPNDARTHSAFAGALERQGDVAGALQQYGIAVKLAPQDAAIRADYDRLAKNSRAESGSSGT